MSNSIRNPYQSTRFTGIEAVKGRLRRQKNHRGLDLCLHHHYTTKIYNTGSTISGGLIIKPKHDVHFDHVRIMLLGRCRVRQDDVNNTSLNYHTFLTLDMPTPSTNTSNGTFLSGVTCSIPFHFVVPHTLLPTACSHSIECDSARSHHTCLPPTMGDWEKDDFAPSMSSIKYEVVAQVLRRKSNDPSSLVKAMETSKRVRILASPPDAISLNDNPKKSQVVSKTKAVQKTPFSKPIGNITFRASSATAIRLSLDAREATPSLITVDVDFDAVDDIAPPKMDNITAKIAAHTWYSGTPMVNFPDQHSISKHYSTSAPLAIECTGDSLWTNAPGKGKSEDNSEQARHKRTLQLVLTPPTREKTFLPTFHSCLISRTYNIALSFRVNRETIAMDIPVKIQSEIEHHMLEEMDLPTFEEALHFV